jgi:hypothetical protein
MVGDARYVGGVMRNYISILGVAPATLLCGLLCSASARADADLELVALIGSGVDTGDAPNNPYALQVGGAAELTLSGTVLGVRATRSMGTDETAKCGASPSCPRSVDDLRTLGVDLGFDWEFALLHISPRLGIGQLSERNDGLKAPYLEPGGVAELEFGLFVAGVDVRYRIAINDSIANGLLGYARAGLRF